MNDFLRNLRSSHKKDNSDPRRNLDGHYYPKEDRRQTFDRRSKSVENLEAFAAVLQDFLPQLAENSAEIAHAVRQLAQNDDLLTQARLRQLNAASKFLDYLNDMVSNHASLSGMRFEDTDVQPAKDYILKDNFTKHDILEIIKTMRKEGHTFAIIAKFLTDKKIPTFSGKGQWHAQTIHRLCK